MPSRTVCKMRRAELNSKSFIGEYPSYTEKWIIKTDMKRYIVVVFTEFDIGCGTETKLKLESKFDWTRQFCNHNKPITAVRLSQTSLTVRFSLDKRDRFLIEGFRAFYEFQSRDDAVLTLLSVEESGMCCISTVTQNRNDTYFSVPLCPVKHDNVKIFSIRKFKLWRITFT